MNERVRMDEFTLETEERIITEACKNARNDLEYVVNIGKSIGLGRTIMNLLGPNRELFLKYESSLALAEGTCIVNAYQLGLEDAKRTEDAV